MSTTRAAAAAAAVLLAAVLARPAHAVPAAIELQIRWSQIQSTPGCYFFSGPNRTGRDTHLGGRATLTLVGNRATLAWGRDSFLGTIAQGRLALRRDGRYTHVRANDYSTTEELAGTFSADPVLVRAHYSYRECEQGATCPGTCTIEAELEGRPWAPPTIAAPAAPPTQNPRP